MSKFLICTMMAITLLIVACCPVSAQDSVETADSFGLDSLLNIEISAASKYGQGVHEAPASITVVTSDGSNIDAGQNVLIARAYGWVALSDNGTNYSIFE